MSRRHHIDEGQCWDNMKQRCYNPKNTHYKYYGARGIKICDRWLKSFEHFLEDMGERPEGMTIDRIDPNGHYEPSNCRWASPTVQSLNQRLRKDNTSGYKGIRLDGRKYVVKFRGKYVGRFTDLMDAIFARRRVEDGTEITE